MERFQLTENDRTKLVNTVAFGVRGTEFDAETIEAAVIDARECIATSSDSVAYVVIRVES